MHLVGGLTSNQIGLRNNAYAAPVRINYGNPSDLMRLHQPLAGIQALLTAASDRIFLYKEANQRGRWIETLGDDTAAEVPISNDPLETSRLVYDRHGTHIRLAEKFGHGLRCIVCMTTNGMLSHYVMDLHRGTPMQYKPRLASSL